VRVIRSITGERRVTVPLRRASGSATADRQGRRDRVALVHREQRDDSVDRSAHDRARALLACAAARRGELGHLRVRGAELRRERVHLHRRDRAARGEAAGALELARELVAPRLGGRERGARLGHAGRLEVRVEGGDRLALAHALALAHVQHRDALGDGSEHPDLDLALHVAEQRDPLLRGVAHGRLHHDEPPPLHATVGGAGSDPIAPEREHEQREDDGGGAHGLHS